MPEEIVEKSPLDIMFDNPVDETPPEETPEQTPEQTPEETPEEAPEQEEEGGEEDYEAPIKKKEIPEPQEEDVEKLPESKARERAKIEGKRRKELEAEKQAWELEKAQLAEELETFKSKANELETTRIKPEEHPDFTSLRDEILKDAKDTLDDFEAPNKGVVYDKLGTFIVKYRAADQAQDRDAQLLALKDDLAAQMFGEDSTWEILEKDDRKEITAAIKLIKNSTAKADKLNTIREDLEKRAKSGTLAMGVKEYESVAKEFQPVLDAIGDLPDDVVESNPHTIEAQVALLAKTPEGKKRLDSAKKDITEVIFGPKPLTQSDIEKIEKNGGNVKEFVANQQKRVHALRLKLLPMLAQGLVTRSIFKDAVSEREALKKAKDSEESEDDALEKIRRKKAPKPEPEKAKSPVDIMFEGA